MTIERKQISVWISAESAALLQRLKQDRGGSIGSIIECAIAAYATSEPTSVDTSIPTSSSLDWSAAIDDLRDEMNSRVLVLEIRLAALEAVRAVKVEPSAIVADNVALRAVGSDDSVSYTHPDVYKRQSCSRPARSAHVDSGAAWISVRCFERSVGSKIIP